MALSSSEPAVTPISRRAAGEEEDLPGLDLDALGSVHVVALPVRGEVLRVGRRRRFKVLGVLGQLQPLGFFPGLVAELDERYGHGQPQPPDQNVEDPGHVAEAQSARLVLATR